MSETGLEVAVAKIETRLEGHLTACERRYQEGNERLQRMFDYIKNAHEKTGTQIAEIQDTLAEQRGASKMAKLMAGAGAGIMGLLGGVGGSHFIK